MVLRMQDAQSPIRDFGTLQFHPVHLPGISLLKFRALCRGLCRLGSCSSVGRPCAFGGEQTNINDLVTHVDVLLMFALIMICHSFDKAHPCNQFGLHGV